MAWENGPPETDGYDGPGHVYFLQCEGGDNYLKIGYSTDPDTRVRRIDTACPYPLRLIALHRGPRELETYLHYIFRQERQCGEWFRPTPQMLHVARNLPAALEQHRNNRRTDVRSFPKGDGERRRMTRANGADWFC